MTNRYQTAYEAGTHKRSCRYFLFRFIAEKRKVSQELEKIIFQSISKAGSSIQRWEEDYISKPIASKTVVKTVIVYSGNGGKNGGSLLERVPAKLAVKMAVFCQR